ncbi:MAG: hypothetical protein EOO06_05285 [Chitinophagaceae bacterium]|nr:MAG: hypothetical protein EOO06_05285 [Chitinophagaceae bacterium]
MRSLKPNEFWRSIFQSIFVALLTSSLSFYLFTRQYKTTHSDKMFDKKVELFDRFTAAELELNSLITNYTEYETRVFSSMKVYADSIQPKRLNGFFVSRAIQYHNRLYPDLYLTSEQFMNKAKEIDNLLATSQFFFEDSATIKTLHKAYGGQTLAAFQNELNRIKAAMQKKPSSPDEEEIDFIPIRDSLFAFNGKVWNDVHLAMTQEITGRKSTNTGF